MSAIARLIVVCVLIKTAIIIGIDIGITIGITTIITISISIPTLFKLGSVKHVSRHSTETNEHIIKRMQMDVRYSRYYRRLRNLTLFYRAIILFEKKTLSICIHVRPIVFLEVLQCGFNLWRRDDVPNQFRTCTGEFESYLNYFAPASLKATWQENTKCVHVRCPDYGWFLRIVWDPSVQNKSGNIENIALPNFKINSIRVSAKHIFAFSSLFGEPKSFPQRESHRVHCQNFRQGMHDQKMFDGSLCTQTVSFSKIHHRFPRNAVT